MIDYDATAAGLDRPAIVMVARGGRFGVPHHISDILRRTLERVVVGETRYRLRTPLTLTFYPFVSDGKGELIPEPDAPDAAGLYPTGRGSTYEEALSDWSAKLHVQIQTLLSKRPWEMAEDERREMSDLERIIDIPAYHKETPVRSRQIGLVIRSRPIPDSVRWEDGTVEHVNLDQMTAEFAAFMNGQRFEAITLRDPNTGRLIGAVHTERLGRLATAPAGEWDKIPTFAESPSVGWDEID